MAGSVGVLVAGLLAGLPAEPVAGTGAPTFAPLAPQAEALRAESNLALDAPFRVQFTKPMNESSVEAAFSIDPKVDVVFKWDATAQILSLAPNPHWTPQTQYQVDISGAATDQQGLSISTPIHATFDSGLQTAGTITATQMVDEPRFTGHSVSADVHPSGQAGDGTDRVRDQPAGAGDDRWRRSD